MNTVALSIDLDGWPDMSVCPINGGRFFLNMFCKNYFFFAVPFDDPSGTEFTHCSFKL